MSDPELQERFVVMRAENRSLGEIAFTLGIPLATAMEWDDSLAERISSLRGAGGGGPAGTVQAGQAVGLAEATSFLGFRRLKMWRHARLPLRCVRCNGDTDVRQVDERRHWVPVWLWPLYLLGVGILIVLMLGFPRKVDYRVPLCGRHRLIRRLSIVVMLAMAVVGFALVFSGFYQLDRLGSGAGLLSHVMIGCGIALMVLCGPAALVIRRFGTPRVVWLTRDHVWLAGVCREYVDSLPAPADSPSARDATEPLRP